MFVTRLVPDDVDAVVGLVQTTNAAVDVAAELERPWGLFWVAREAAGAPPVAFLLAWAVADELHLMHIATHPGARRRGAARALMQALVAHAVELRSRLVLLEVRRTNRSAIRLYRSFGFSAMGVRRSYYSDGEDAVEMMLALDPATGNLKPGHDEIEIAEAR